VSAYAPPYDNTDALLGVTERQIAAVKKAGVSRLIVVGGAGLLDVAPGVTLIASGYLPEAFLPIARSHESALGILKGSDVSWSRFTFSKPSGGSPIWSQRLLGTDSAVKKSSRRTWTCCSAPKS
jgi:putative NADH-flavin reductase